MRILHVYRTYFPDPQGGLQEAIRQISLATAGLGVQSRIFTLSPHPSPATIERPEGLVVRSRSWAAPASCDIGGHAALRRFREQVEWADLVHYYFPWPFADLLHWLAPVRKPAVMTYVSDIVRQRMIGRLYRPLMKCTLHAMQAIVTASPAYARTSQVLATLVPPERLQVIPLGIVEHSYQDARREAAHIDTAAQFAEPFRKFAKAARQPSGLRSEGRFFLALGVLRYYKGLHILIEAAAASRLPVAIAGDGPQRSALEAHARALDAPVAFLGHVSDAEKMALLRDCDALVLPSHLRSEAFGMVLVEAAMSSRPMISCEIGTGTSFVNQHGSTGLVVPPQDSVALAQAMRTLDQDVAMRERFGVAARERYDAFFAGEALGRAHANLYRRVLRGKL
ncbi:glycosyltransferase [Immundisolibacter sp.]